MENKTSYTLQDAKDDVAIKEGFFSYEDAVSLGSYMVDSVAKKWAEKATEELRKENDSKAEVIGSMRGLNQTLMNDIITYKGEIERLKESNKELVERFKGLQN